MIDLFDDPENCMTYDPEKDKSKDDHADHVQVKVPVSPDRIRFAAEYAAEKPFCAPYFLDLVFVQ